MRLKLTVLALTFMLGMSISASAIPCFQNPITYPFRVFDITSADFNRDSKPDLAVTTGGGKTITLLLGNGDGTFQVGQSYPQRLFVGGIVAADLNHDGKLDMIAPLADFAERTTGIVVLLGNGDGSFQNAAFYRTKPEPGSVVVGDIIEDGNPDVAVLHQGDSLISLFTGHGDGTLGEAQIIQLPSTLYTSLVAGKLNGDGHLDLVLTSETLNQRGEATVILGKGNGTFQNPVTYPLGGNSAGRGQLADFNHDAKLDFVALTPLGEEGTDGATVMLGNGDGSFGAPQILAGSGNFEPVVLEVADVNSDGIPDLLDTTEALPTLTYFRGVGDGTFRGKLTAGTGLALIRVEPVDLNGDGEIDLATVAAQGSTLMLQVYLNSGQCH